METGTVRLGADNFESILKKEGLLLLDWWAPWCGPCRMFGPIYDRVAGRHPDVTFAKVNTEEEPELAEAFGIRSIPTVMVMRDGVVLFKEAGTLPEKALETLVTEALKVDMEEVRQNIAEQQK